MKRRTMIEATGLSVHFDRFDLGPVSFTIPIGARVALLGRNGSGKTTLMRALSGRLPEVRGTACVGGHDVRRHRAGIRRIVGYSDHRPSGFIWMSVADHLRFMGALRPGWDARRAAELCEQFGLQPSALIAQLSRGMQARLALAGVEAYRPPVLMLDEPTAALDPDTRARVIEQLDRSCQPGGGRTLVFSTHHPDEVVRLADRVIVLDRGRIVHDTPLPPFGSAAERAGSRERRVRRLMVSVTPADAVETHG